MELAERGAQRRQMVVGQKTDLGYLVRIECDEPQRELAEISI
jgi:hypothetical protein